MKNLCSVIKAWFKKLFSKPVKSDKTIATKSVNVLGNWTLIDKNKRFELNFHTNWMFSGSTDHGMFEGRYSITSKIISWDGVTEKGDAKPSMFNQPCTYTISRGILRILSSTDEWTFTSI